MQGLATLAVLAAFAAGPAHNSQHRCTVKEFRPFSAKVWNVDRWQRGAPPVKVIAAQRHFLACAGPGNRRAMQKTWRRDRGTYLASRRGHLAREALRPFVYPDGSHWAVPYPIAWCESGGNYFVGPSGAYGLIPPFPQWLSPAEQDRIAHELYLEQGEGPWAPYEGGCAYR